MKIKEFAKFFEYAGLTLSKKEGFCFGDLEQELTGVMVSFTATLDASEATRKAGCNLLVIHDRMFFPTAYSLGELAHNLNDRINLARLKGLTDGNIAVVILNDSIELPFMRRAAEEALGLPHADKLSGCYELTDTTVASFCRLLTEQIGAKNIRVTGALDAPVRTLGILNGGQGITRTPDGMKEMLFAMPDAILCGETDEYPQWAAADMGIALVQIGHVFFDNLGLKMLCDCIGKWLPEYPVLFHETETAWRIV